MWRKKSNMSVIINFILFGTTNITYALPYGYCVMYHKEVLTLLVSFAMH